MSTTSANLTVSKFEIYLASISRTSSSIENARVYLEVALLTVAYFSKVINIVFVRRLDAHLCGIEFG